jgi:hypothetical protein
VPIPCQARDKLIGDKLKLKIIIKPLPEGGGFLLLMIPMAKRKSAR